MTVPARTAVLAAGTLLLAGCGSSSGTSTTTTSAKTVDTATIESQIDQQLSTSTAEVTKVDCPSDVASGTGTTFTCTVTWSTGATGKVKATQTGVSRYTYEVVEGSVQIPGANLEQQIEDDLAKQGAPDATANCPDTVIVKVGTTVTCDVTSASGAAAGAVKFTFSSEDGSVDPASVETM